MRRPTSIARLLAAFGRRRAGAPSDDAASARAPETATASTAKQGSAHLPATGGHRVVRPEDEDRRLREGEKLPFGVNP